LIGESSSHRNITSSEPQTEAHYSTAIKNNQPYNTPFNLELNWASFAPRRQTIRDRDGEISIGESSSHQNITSSEPQTQAHYSTAIQNNQAYNTPFDLKLNWASFAPPRQRITDRGGEISIGESSSHRNITSLEPQTQAHYSMAIQNNQPYDTPLNLELNWASFAPRRQTIIDRGGEILIGESSSRRNITSSEPQTQAHYSTAIKNNQPYNTPLDLEWNWASQLAVKMCWLIVGCRWLC